MKPQRSTGVLDTYMRERGKAETRPPSRVIVAAVNKGSFRHDIDGNKRDHRRTINVGPGPAGQE